MNGATTRATPTPIQSKVSDIFFDNSAKTINFSSMVSSVPSFQEKSAPQNVTYPEPQILSLSQVQNKATPNMDCMRSINQFKPIVNEPSMNMQSLNIPAMQMPTLKPKFSLAKQMSQSSANKENVITVGLVGTPSMPSGTPTSAKDSNKFELPEKTMSGGVRRKAKAQEKKAEFENRQVVKIAKEPSQEDGARVQKRLKMDSRRSQLMNLESFRFCLGQLSIVRKLSNAVQEQTTCSNENSSALTADHKVTV